jgi:hypothetical protein
MERLGGDVGDGDGDGGQQSVVSKTETNRGNYDDLTTMTSNRSRRMNNSAGGASAGPGAGAPPQHMYGSIDDNDMLCSFLKGGGMPEGFILAS